MGVHLSTEQHANLDTIPKRVLHWAETLPDRELFVFYNGQSRRSYTSRQIVHMAGKFANRLRGEYGFKKGDYIVNTLPNSPERLFTDLGITLSGCISMNGSTMFSDGVDFLVAAKSSGLVAVIVCPEGNTPAWRVLERYVEQEELTPLTTLKCDMAPAMRTAILVSRNPQGNRRPFLQDLEDIDLDIFVEPNIRSCDTCHVFTTSGTTGYSKLVTKTHKQTIDMWSVMRDRIRSQSLQVWTDVVIYNDRTIGWMGGYPYATYVNADRRILLDVFDTVGSKMGSDAWSIICKEKVDYALILPLDLDYMMKHTQEKIGYKLKLILSGGQPIRKKQFQNYSVVSHDVAILYGSTEAGFVSLGIIQDPDVKDYYCDQVLPGTELRIVDDDGRLCKTGVIGNIQVRGDFLFKGYLNVVDNPDPKTLTAFTQDGWFKVEDSGYFDEDSNLYVMGRLKDVITLGGTNVYPSWLEAKIVGYPGVEEICIVPVSDPILYQNICAIVKRRPGRDVTEKELDIFCRNLFLEDEDAEGTPIPKFYMILDEFPKTANGKVDRGNLQKLAEQKFGIK